MESLINVQEEAYTRIIKAYSNFKKSPKERITKLYCQSKLEALEKVWQEFTTGHKQLVQSAAPAELKKTNYSIKEIYELAEDCFITYKCMLKELLSDLTESEPKLRNQGRAHNSNQLLKLPKINIPIFSGKYSEWITFHDLFNSLIENNDSLDGVQKLNYLKGYLSGEAEQLVRHIPITECNYARCWELLKSRYNNKRFMSHNIIQRMLNQKGAASESSASLKGLIDTTSECLNALESLGVQIKNWDILIIHMLTLKLDPETRKQWELFVTSDKEADLPTFEQFKEFITNRFRALELIERGACSIQRQKQSFLPVAKPRTFHVVADSAQSCKLCSSGVHKLYGCKKFIGMTTEQRREYVQNNGFCFKCLGFNHSARQCRTPIKCKVCQRHHHSLIHTSIVGHAGDKGKPESTTTVVVEEKAEEKAKEKAEDKAEEKAENTTKIIATNTAAVRANKSVLLATALVDGQSKSGQFCTLRALLDQGSQACFITEATVQLLKLEKIPVRGLITGIGGGKNVNSSSMVQLTVKSRVNPEVQIKVAAHVLKVITTPLPSRKIVELNWLPLDCKLADPEYHDPNRIDILLGAEVYGQVLEEGVLKDPSGLIVAQSTSLGWVITGLVETQISTHIAVLHTIMEENDILKKFWELEAEPQKAKMFTEEEKKCEENFEKTTRRDVEGRYIVKLPFKNENPACKDGNSKKIAIKRFMALEKRLEKNEVIKEEYKKIFNEYLQLNYMAPVKDEELCKPAVYLPYHEVVREDKDTTKVRVVMNASNRDENGMSLNDDLMIGPTLQPELRHIIMRWRTYPIVLVADITKMYHQIKMDEDDANYQRIVWRDGSGKLAEYKLLRVTFGTSCAPYLAVKCLRQVAKDEGDNYPLAAERVFRDFYMDDLLSGCESVDKGVLIYNEINEMLGKAGFKLQKWSSNSEEILKRIKNEGEEKEEGEGLKFKIDYIMKILGLTWNRSEDSFKYAVTLSKPKQPLTKRNITAEIAKLFDPLGWAAPTIVQAKVLIQKLWLAGVSWDEEVPTNIVKEWLKYRDDLKMLENIVVPRWLGLKESDKIVELHGFCDASKVAYAAVVYIRAIGRDGIVRVGLVTAKTKVAPLKQVSIPRLELCGAVLVAKLLEEVGEVMNIPKQRQYAWTDSTVVLAWINSHPSRWKTFVANRVSDILGILEPPQWSHVSSKQNPADIASRGLSPSELEKSSIWFNGPENLKKEKVTLTKLKEINTNLEEAKIAGTTIYEDSWWEKYSSLAKLIRVVAYCRRFLNLKKPENERHKSKILTKEEMDEAIKGCIKGYQMQNFEEEIKALKRNQKLKRNSKILTLNPYLDEENILRVGGRLENSQLTLDKKHPMLMPKKGGLTKLLIDDAHKKTLHGGPQLMLGYLHSKYWILGVKQLVKAHARKCTVCVRNAAVVRNQLMGQLPSARVTPSRPFQRSGVDYAGPINLRISKGRGQRSFKGYICLFLCMSTRAIHLEVVSDLTSEGFLAAFRRFVSRRGHCSDLWSDNGTNFVGAARELKQLFDAEKSRMTTEVAESLANNGTTWHFIPPRAPNFGGLWEAGVKSTKHHLKRVIGDSTLTFEEITTVLAQIEACLNSRPLSKISDSPNDPIPLTPGHFLVGEPLVTVPGNNYESSNISVLRRWQMTQRMVQDFWRRWSREYLTQFQRRYKWSDQRPEPQVGDVVLVMEDGLPPTKWLYGLVTMKHTGLDGITRVVSLRCKQSVIKRPVSKLCFLPVVE